MGVDTDGLDAAVQRSIRSEFPEWKTSALEVSPRP
jgi:hypothetical protein